MFKKVICNDVRHSRLNFIKKFKLSCWKIIGKKGGY